jgi:excisionase family DNA binding protein
VTDTTWVSADRTLPDPRLEPTISVARAARILDVSPRAVYQAIKAGQCPSATVGRRVLIPTARFLRRYGLTEEEP